MHRRPAAARPAPAAQLSLFDAAPAAAAPATGDAADGERPRQRTRDGARSTPLLAPTEFRHPQADRELWLDDHLIAYALRRARRRSIGFIVGTDGLSVNAPRWVGIADIESALREKAGWILRKLVEQRERANLLQAARVDWCDGSELPFLGASIVIVLDPLVRGAVLDAAATDGQTRELRLGLPRDASAAQIRDTVQSWLQRQARELFEARCRHYAAQLGVSYRRIGLSSAQTRWGSASSNGTIRLNWRLVHFGLATVDYVVAHELAHLREMNHSPRFWDIVRSVLPDYESARHTLKREVLPVFD
ncbi:M48 family metallopeptidase [Piscinibacter sakaiensis]|uniref:M48 family metallopeptidase n=1 Tax=Piscinibacter sakaiensis TaxID=1547922 RepID=UPI003AAD3DDE